MKILHVAPSFYPAHYYGGPVQSTLHLCRKLAERGCEVRALTTNANGPTVLDVPTGSEVEVAPGCGWSMPGARAARIHSRPR